MKKQLQYFLQEVSKLKTKKKQKKGSSLVEALISVAIISFVVVSILSGFTQQQADTRRNSDKNTAVMLAEQGMEEIIKFPYDQLVEEVYVNYFVPKPNGYDFYAEDDDPPNQLRQFRRTVEIDKGEGIVSGVGSPKGDFVKKLAVITVTVEYGAQKKSVAESTLIYPYQVQLISRRSNL
jgi:hypothetical protein